MGRNKDRKGIYIESFRISKMTVLARSLLKAAANRQFSTSIARRSGHGVEPPGANLPFQIQNRFRLAMNFCIFFATGFGAPLLHGEAPDAQDASGLDAPRPWFE